MAPGGGAAHGRRSAMRKPLDHLAQLQVDGGREGRARASSRPPEQQAELDGLWSRVQVSPLYQSYIAARTNFDKMMYRINEMILRG